MKKAFSLVLLAIILSVPFFVSGADTCSVANQDCIDQIGRDINKLNTELKDKTTGRQSMLAQLEDIKARIVALGQEIKKSEQALVYQKQLLEERARSYYKNITNSSLSVIDLLVAKNFSDSLNKFFYQKRTVDEDKNTIIKIVLFIKNLEEQKTKLAALQVEVDHQSQLLSAQIEQTKQQIAVLSARQQQLIAQKLASLNISRSASSMGRCDSDLTNGRDPGFSPRFGFFTFGVPNRVGLNQYGAKGRAEAGQNYETILRAYYNFDEIKQFDENIQIRVDGYNDPYKLDDYVKRIYEVPGDWPAEALKAQAIAARSYALAYTNSGTGSICATESCQVFQGNPKEGAWSQAVDDTKGKAMVQGGSAIKAWFSSTHGGYTFSSGEIGWSGTGWTKHANDFDGTVSSFSDLQSRAYDKNSPWFYCDWGSRGEYNKTAWLKPEEIADIVNVIMLAKSDSSTTEHLYQPDKPNPAGTDTWDRERVKSELKNRGGNPYSSVSDISVSADFGSGRATSININGDVGSNSFDAGEFKNWFNLRAPSNIQIVGPLFNAEKK